MALRQSSNAVCVSPTTANRSRAGGGSATSRRDVLPVHAPVPILRRQRVRAVLEAGDDERRRDGYDPHALTMVSGLGGRTPRTGVRNAPRVASADAARASERARASRWPCTLTRRTPTVRRASACPSSSSTARVRSSRQSTGAARVRARERRPASSPAPRAPCSSRGASQPHFAAAIAAADLLHLLRPRATREEPRPKGAVMAIRKPIHVTTADLERLRALVDQNLSSRDADAAARLDEELESRDPGRRRAARRRHDERARRVRGRGERRAPRRRARLPGARRTRPRGASRCWRRSARRCSGSRSATTSSGRSRTGGSRGFASCPSRTSPSRPA